MFTVNCAGRLVVFERPLVMGILNINKDSFYEGSRVQAVDAALIKASKMLQEGADILDIGGQSTRPGSTRISASEELERVLPVIRSIKNEHENALLSIDTYHAKVARTAVAEGVSIVNDISGGEMDPDMITSVADLGVPFICMHMKGTPGTMQQEAVYVDVVSEVLDFFIGKLARLRMAGVKDVIIDPGFGFGKTARHNFILLQNLSLLKMCGVPLMAGISRKSTIYKTLDIAVENSLNGTTVLHTVALEKGADILRVHDVREACEAVKLIAAYGQAQTPRG